MRSSSKGVAFVIYMSLGAAKTERSMGSSADTAPASSGTVSWRDFTYAMASGGERVKICSSSRLLNRHMPQCHVPSTAPVPHIRDRKVGAASRILRSRNRPSSAW